MRHRSLCLSVVLGCLVFGLGSYQAAAKELKRYDKGTESCRVLDQDGSLWWGRGRRLFIERCKSCHTRTNDKGAPFLHVESMIPRAWNRVFYEKYPKCAKQGAWEGLTLQDQLVLNDYLWRYGAGTYDAYDESRCG